MVPRFNTCSPAVRLLSATPSPSEDKKKKPSRWETIKQTFREHGKVFVLYYTATWLGGFGVAFGGVTLAGLDGVALLQYLGADSVMLLCKTKSSALSWLFSVLSEGVSPLQHRCLS